MFAAKVPTKQICLETGQDEAAIKKMRRAWRNAGRPAPVTDTPIPATSAPSAIRPIDLQGTPEARETAIWQGLQDAIAYTVSELQISAGISDSRERTYATTAHMKILSGLLAKAGSWAGMDHPAEVQEDAHVDVVWEAEQDARRTGNEDAVIEITPESVWYNPAWGGRQFEYHSRTYIIGGHRTGDEWEDRGAIFVDEPPSDLQAAAQAEPTEG